VLRLSKSERNPNSSRWNSADEGLERLAAAGIEPSVGSKGDSFDNALAESVIGLYKTELVKNLGPWTGLDELELATLEWVDWWNHRRLLGPIGYVPPAEFEQRWANELSEGTANG
jgi:putative transposase